MRRPVLPLVLPVLLALALLTGCTGGGTDSGAASSGGGQAAGDTAAEGGEQGGGGALAPVGAPARLQAPLAGRSVVRTAELRVRVPDVWAAAERAGDVVLGAGGVLAGEQRADGAATLQLRVPPARLDDALGRLAGLGEELDRNVTSEDVTEQVVDLDSRLATQRASVARVRALLEGAQSLGDVVKVEGELAKREAELESLSARARALSSRVELAAVVLHLEQEGGATAAAPAGFGQGLEAGWSALRTTLRVGATVVGALLPFTPLLLLLGGFALWRRRRTAPAA